MEDHKPIPYFPIVIDSKDYDNEVEKLFAELRPEWKTEDMEITKFSEGYVNQMKMFRLKTDTDHKDAIVVRVHSSAFAEFANRSGEYLAMQLAYAAGCFTPILAIFKNGVAYKFAPGRTLTGHDLVNPDIIRKTTRKLAQFHMVDSGKFPLVDGNGETCEIDRSDRFEMIMKMFVSQYPEHLSDPEEDNILQKHGLSKAEVEEGFAEVTKVRESLNIPLGLCHGDFHVKNIVYDEQTGDITILDYEMTGTRERYSDIFNIVYNTDAFLLIGILTPDDPPITEEILSLWRRSYMEAKYEILGKDPQKIPDVVLEQMELELQLLNTMHAFVGAVACVAMSQNPAITLPLMQGLHSVVKKWKDSKQLLPGLCERYTKVTTMCKEEAETSL